jgi:diguanylate cyclase (GGDEF)-like protein/PAS domain S-box-containing protein
VEFGEFEQVLKDDRPVLTAFRVSPLYSFAVVTHVQRDYALKQWSTETKTILAIVVPTLILISLFAIVFYRRQLLLEDKTAESHRLQQINAARVFTNSREGILICTPDGCIIDVNDAFTRITGYTRVEVLGQNPRILSSGRQSKEFYADLWRNLIEHGFWSGEMWIRNKYGAIFAEMLTISAVPDSQGVVQQFVAQFSDITERKVIEDEVRGMAFYDPLTMLPNRRMLSDRLVQAMAASKRSGLCGALMFLDLDNFKPLNDTHGHELGDLLLIEVANRLKSCLREVDTVARFGGDEFVVLLSELHVDKTQSTEQARGVAEKIRVSVAAPYFLAPVQPVRDAKDIEHHCSTSIGVVVFLGHDVSQNDLMKCADAAMYQAKDEGRNAIRLYGIPQ